MDAAEHLWVLEYRPPGDATQRWSVFDPDGRWLGVLTAPEGFHMTDVGADYVLGWATDSLDVAYVQMYGLLKGAE